MDNKLKVFFNYDRNGWKKGVLPYEKSNFIYQELLIKEFKCRLIVVSINNYYDCYIRVNDNQLKKILSEKIKNDIIYLMKNKTISQTNVFSTIEKKLIIFSDFIILKMAEYLI